MSRELDAKIAEIMGLQVLGFARATTYECADDWIIQGEDGNQPVYLSECCCDDKRMEPVGRIFGHHTLCLQVVPRYSSNANDSALMEERLKELGLMREYGLCLARELGLFDDEREMGDLEGKDLFVLAHASPEVRCVAALEAVELSRTGEVSSRG